MKLDVTLSPNEVEEAVKLYLESKGYDVESVSFNIEKKWAGYGTSEHEETVFSGASASVKD